MKHFNSFVRINKMKLIIKCVLFVVAVFACFKFCNQKTKGFTLSRIQSDLSFNVEWEVNNPPLPEIENIFNQPFHYLEAGGQCFAFASEDGLYVLKFFKHHLRRLPLWKKVLPLPKNQAHIDKLLCKLHRDFASYKLAVEQLSEDSGLLLVHLNKTTDLKQSVCLVDKLGIAHSIDLDKFEFVLQRKAILPYQHFTELVEKNDLPGAYESIASIFTLFENRCKKGIHDEDAKIHRNVGFIGNRAILIDGGRLVIDPTRKDPAIQLEDLIQATMRLKEFLQTISPELVQYLDQQIEERKNV